MYLFIVLCLASPSATEALRTSPARPGPPLGRSGVLGTANLRTKILGFRGFDSSRVLDSWGGVLMSIGNLPEE